MRDRGVNAKCESGSSRFQPGEGPSRGLLRDYEHSDGTFSSTNDICNHGRPIQGPVCCSPVAALKTAFPGSKCGCCVFRRRKTLLFPRLVAGPVQRSPRITFLGAGTRVLSRHNACIPCSPVCCLTMITYQNCSPAFPATIHLSLLAAKPSIFPPVAWDHGRKLMGGWVLGRCSGYISHIHTGILPI